MRAGTSHAGAFSALSCAVLWVCAPLAVHAQDADASASAQADSGVALAPAGPDVLDPSVAEDVARAEVWGSTVRSVDLDAPDEVDRTAALQLLGIRVGDRLEAMAVRRAVRRLVLLGHVEDVQVWAVPLADGEDSVTLMVRLVGARIIRDIRFETLRNVDVQAIRRGLGVSEGDAADDTMLEGASARLREALRQEGYPAAVASAVFKPLADKPGAVTLVFSVAQGAPLKTSEVRLEGQLTFSRPELMDVVAPVFPPWAPSLGRGGLASASRLKAAADRLQKFYFSRGHYSARVEPQPIPQSTDGRWVPLTLRIRSGPRWVVAFRGNRAVASVDLRRALPLPPERPLDADVVAGLEEVVRQQYRNVGYLHVKVSLRAAPGTQPGTRRMLFSIQEGPFAEVRRVTVKGAAGTPFSREQLENEVVGAASEGITADVGILQRMDRWDVESILSSGDSERWAYPQADDTRVGRSHGYTEWPRTLFGRLADEERVYDASRWERGNRALEDVLKSRGFLQPRVQGPNTTFRLDGRQVDVQFLVNAGVQTRVRSLSFRGWEALEPAQLLDVAQTSADLKRLDLGKPLDLFAVEEARVALTELYARSGYPFARVTDEVAYDGSRKEADVVFVVEEGQRVTLGDIRMVGNEATRDLVLRDQFTVRSGQLFNADEVEATRRRLMQLGLFSSVTVELAPGEQGAVRTLVVAVRERDFRELDGSIGGGADTGPRAFLSFTHRNLLGLGVVNNVRGRINWPYPMYFTPLVAPEQRDALTGRFDDDIAAALNTAYRLTPGNVPAPPGDTARVISPLLFTEAELAVTLGYPRIVLVPTNPGVRAEFILVRANRFAFTLTKAGLVFTGDLKAPPLKYLRASASPSAAVQLNALQCEVKGTGNQTGSTCADDPTRLTRRLDNGVLALTTLRIPVTLDGRDSIFRPHAGYLVNGTADLVTGGGLLFGLGGDPRPVRSTFARLAGGVTGYLPLTRAFTLALGARAGAIVPLGPDVVSTPAGDLQHYVPLFERFYLGGSDSVRGFTPDGVLASDDPNADPSVKPRPLVSQGGNTFWNVRSELRFPLAGPLEGGVFVDAGQLLVASPLDWAQDPSVLNPAAFSAGVGAGVRLNTPVGPLVLDLGFGFLDGQRGISQDDLIRRFVFHPALGYF